MFEISQAFGLIISKINHIYVKKLVYRMQDRLFLPFLVNFEIISISLIFCFDDILNLF